MPRYFKALQLQRSFSRMFLDAAGVRVRPIWAAPAAGQVADFFSDLARPGFGTLRASPEEREGKSTPHLRVLGEMLPADSNV